MRKKKPKHKKRRRNKKITKSYTVNISSFWSRVVLTGWDHDA